MNKISKQKNMEKLWNMNKNKWKRHNRYRFISHIGPATKPTEIMPFNTIVGFRGSRSTKRCPHLLARNAFIKALKTQCTWVYKINLGYNRNRKYWYDTYWILIW